MRGRHLNPRRQDFFSQNPGSLSVELTHRCVILILCLVAFSLSNPAHAQFDYTITNNSVKITNFYGGFENVTIPENILGLPVTIIGARAFYNKPVVNVTIPDTVITIETNAFAW